MSLHLVLGRILLALLLLAGGAVIAGTPEKANAGTTLLGAAPQQAGSIQAPLPHVDRGRASAVMLDPTWGDTDDDTKVFLFAPAKGAPALFGQSLVLTPPRPPSPLSHWPCAGTPTGPPHS